MQVIMMESEAYQNLIDRLERIEKYVIRATERQAALDDEDVWLDNEQVCQLLDVPQGDTQGGTQDDIQGNTLDIWIEEQIRKNPKVTTEELVTLSSFTSKTIKRHINKTSFESYKTSLSPCTKQVPKLYPSPTQAHGAP